MKTTIIYLILLLGLFHQIKAQTTFIPDANFESKLISLGIDSDGLVNGQILNSDAAIPTVLDLSNSNITDLTGIVAFTNLDKLNCSQNSLTLLDISQTNIDTLYCNHNAITILTLPITGTIQNLDCRQNQLTSLDVFAQTNLDYMDISINSITTLDLTNNTALTGMRADANQLTAIDLTNNTLLSFFFMGHNQLTTLDLTNNPLITDLGVGNNFLTSLDLTNNTLIEVLSVNYNQLTTLDLTSNVALEKLHFSYNSITTIDFSNQAVLKEVYGTHNQLTQVSFAANTALEKIYLNNNQLTSINLTNNVSLTHLEVSYNQLTTLDVTNTTALIYLYADFNQITALNVSNNLVLGQIKATNNQLTTLDLTNNVQMWSVQADRCQLTSVLLPVSTIVHTISFVGNQLTNLDVSNCPNLLYLQLGANQLSSMYLGANPRLRSIYIGENQLTQLNLINNPNLSVVYALNNSPALVICVTSLSIISTPAWQKDATAIYTTSCGSDAIQVNIKVDANTNCLIDSTEAFLPYQIVRFERQSDGLILDLHTHDTMNIYPFYIDTGVYVVTIATNHPYWQPCLASQILTVDTTIALQVLDFSMQPIIFCPRLEVDLSAPFLRMTGGGSNYSISYCNTGTTTAQNAYVEVDLDIDLNYLGSSIPLISQTGNIYRFDIGNVNSGDCGSFNIQVVVDTSSQIRQTHCTSVHIYPDSICTPVITVPSIIGSASCQNDTVVFYLENIGAAMFQTHKFDIFEDNIAMRTGTIQLSNGQSTNIIQPALEGKTYRIMVEQVPNYPSVLGDPTFSTAIEGCNPRSNGSFNTGFITQFSNGLSQPSQAIDCQQNIAAYDPNDKLGQPIGYGTLHYIDTLTAIDYRVRFQNTGTDTAFNVVILDTLSPFVNPASIRMGASSHMYNWSLLSGNILRVDFPNILLVDSNANEPLSHGFFRYRIEQQPNNALGSVIYNQAAIYFDYNPPIFTNTTFHTIGEDFVTKILLSVEKILEDELEVLVYPNPFEESTTIAVEGAAFEVLEIQVFDLLGRKVAYQQASDTSQVELRRGQMESGMYVYRLIGDNKLISTGKVKVE